MPAQGRVNPVSPPPGTGDTGRGCHVSGTNAGATDINNSFFTTSGRYICTRYPDFDSFTGSLDEQMMWSVALPRTYPGADRQTHHLARP